MVQAASYLKHFIDERAEVRLMLHDELGPYGSGLKHLYDCLRRLSFVGPQAKGTLEIMGLEGRAAKGTELFAEDYAIVLTTAHPGSIPAKVWRAAHVIYV